MNRKDAIAWMLRVCASLRLSQAKTLSELVLAACHLTRASLAELGRCLAMHTPVTVKAFIKRVDRFVGNANVEPAEAMRGIVEFLAQPRKKLLILMDWVDIRSFPCIMLAARIRGRALPLLWTICRDHELHRSRNNLEYALFQLLRTMVPASTQIVVLADRGFGRAEMARECQTLGFDFLIRIQPDVHVKHREYTGKLLDLPVTRGHQKVYRDVLYRSMNKPVTANVAVVWLESKDEPWFLLTSLPRLQGIQLTKLYARRMSIEEYFRDTKSLRNGFALRLTLIENPKRLERLLLVLAIAYVLLVALGLHCSTRYHGGHWCTTNRPNECSLVMIGHVMLPRLPAPAALMPMLRALRRELTDGNWG